MSRTGPHRPVSIRSRFRGQNSPGRSAQPVAMQPEIHMRNAALGDNMVVKSDPMITSDWAMETSAM